MGPRAMRSLPATSSQPGVPWGLLSTVPTSHTGEASLGHSQQQRHKFERSGLPWGLPEILWGYLSLPRRVSELQVWSKCCACLWGDVSLAPGTGKGNNWGEQPSSLSPSSSAPTPLCTQSLSQDGATFLFLFYLPQGQRMWVPASRCYAGRLGEVGISQPRPVPWVLRT